MAEESSVSPARFESVNPSLAIRTMFNDYALGTIDADEMIERALRMYGPDAEPTSFLEQTVR